MSVVAVVVVGAFGAAPAGAQWLSPTGIPPAGLPSPVLSTVRPAIAVDGAGRQTAAFTATEGSFTDVRIATRAPGGTWNSRVYAFDATAFPQGTAQLAVNARGDAILAFPRSDGANMRVWAMYRPGASGRWENPQMVSPAGAGVSPNDSLRVAINEHGNAVIAYASGAGTGLGAGHVFATTRQGPDSWTTPVDYSRANTASHSPGVAIDEDARVTVAWCNQTNVLQVARSRDLGTGVTAPMQLSGAEAAFDQSLAIDGRGRVTVTWIASSPDGFQVRARRSIGGTGGFAPADDLSSVGPTPVSEARVAADGPGNLVVAWLSGNGALLNVAQRPAGQDWNAVRTSVLPRFVAGLTAAMSRSDGRVAIAYSESFTSAIMVAQGRTGSDLAAPQAALPSSQNITFGLYVDDQGNTGLIDGGQDSPTTASPRSVVDDRTGPLLTALSVPASGVAGRVVKVAVSASDTWSAVGAVRWDFGDGTTMTGAAGQHSFARPGTYPVKVTVTDTAGNTTVATRTIAIGAAPPPSALRAAVGAPKQTLRSAAKRRALRATCTLSQAGTCAVKASVSARTAGKLGLKTRKGTKTVTLSSAKPVAAAAGRPASVTLKLTNRAARAIARAKTLKLTLTATGRATATSKSATTKRTITLRR